MALQSGRSLRFAPDWPCSDATVVFDRNSGDFWVISSLSASALRLLQEHGSLAWPELERRLAVVQLDADMSLSLMATVKSLVDNGLIRTAQNSVTSALSTDGLAR